MSRRKKNEETEFPELETKARSPGKRIMLRGILGYGFLFFVSIYGGVLGRNMILPWWLWLVGGGFFLYTQAYGWGLWQWILRHSIEAIWPTGRSTIGDLKPVRVINPPQAEREKKNLFVEFGEGETKSRYEYPLVAFVHGGPSYLLHWPGHHFLVVPWIERAQIVDGVVKLLNYSIMREWFPEAVIFNADTTEAQEHKYVPDYILRELASTEYYRSDSKITWSLWPKVDFSKMEAISVPAELKAMLEQQARRVRVSEAQLDEFINRVRQVVGKPGAAPPPPMPQAPGQGQERTW